MPTRSQILSKYLSRKFWMAGCGLVALFFLRWHDKLDSGDFVTAFLGCVGAYITTQAIHDAAEIFAKRKVE